MCAMLWPLHAFRFRCWTEMVLLLNAERCSLVCVCVCTVCQFDILSSIFRLQQHKIEKNNIQFVTPINWPIKRNRRTECHKLQYKNVIISNRVANNRVKYDIVCVTGPHCDTARVLLLLPLLWLLFLLLNALCLICLCLSLHCQR